MQNQVAQAIVSCPSRTSSASSSASTSASCAWTPSTARRSSSVLRTGPPQTRADASAILNVIVNSESPCICSFALLTAVVIRLLFRWGYVPTFASGCPQLGSRRVLWVSRYRQSTNLCCSAAEGAWPTIPRDPATRHLAVTSRTISVFDFNAILCAETAGEPRKMVLLVEDQGCVDRPRRRIAETATRYLLPGTGPCCRKR